MANDQAAPSRVLFAGAVDYNAAPSEHRAKTATDRLIAGRSRGTERDKAGQLWEQLPGSLRELETLKAITSQTPDVRQFDTLTGPTVTKTKFMEAAPNYNIIHVSTHGYFESADVQSLGRVAMSGYSSKRAGNANMLTAWEPGLLSGLVMAGANTANTIAGRGHSDSIVRSAEIEAMSLEGVDLIVLAACETGLGAVAGGEGLTGLQRAFQIAGADSVIASLWGVDDAATQELMKRCYSNMLLKNQSRADSLRNAQLWLLTHPDELKQLGIQGVTGRGVPGKTPARGTNAPRKSSKTHPFYWAAFQLSGDWR